MRGVRYRIKTLPSGKKVRQTISPTGRIVRATPVKTNRTRTGRRLNKRRRRIHK